MSEYEILDLLASASAEQTTVIAQLVSLHLAMVVGIYYFLHRSGLPMKLAIAALYSLAFAMHLGLLVTQSDLIVGARNDLIAITETGGQIVQSRLCDAQPVPRAARNLGEYRRQCFHLLIVVWHDRFSVLLEAAEGGVVCPLNF